VIQKGHTISLYNMIICDVYVSCLTILSCLSYGRYAFIMIEKLRLLDAFANSYTY
jgi:hypothetical protein